MTAANASKTKWRVIIHSDVMGRSLLQTFSQEAKALAVFNAFNPSREANVFSLQLHRSEPDGKWTLVHHKDRDRSI